jgi:hypothetical protein
MNNFYLQDLFSLKPLLYMPVKIIVSKKASEKCDKIIDSNLSHFIHTNL